MQLEFDHGEWPGHGDSLPWWFEWIEVHTWSRKQTLEQARDRETRYGNVQWRRPWHRPSSHSEFDNGDAGASASTYSGAFATTVLPSKLGPASSRTFNCSIPRRTDHDSNRDTNFVSDCVSDCCLYMPASCSSFIATNRQNLGAICGKILASCSASHDAAILCRVH